MSKLRVMSFNLAGGFDEHEPGNAWIGSGRSQLVCDVIEDASPDLIGFQETQWPNFAKFGETLVAYDSFQGPHANDPPHLFNPVYWRRERLQPRSRGGFWISETPEKYSRSWDSACVRTATWVRFRDLANGMDFLHVNVHLDHISEPARTGGASLLNRWTSNAASDGELQLLTGDFNCNPWTPEVEDAAAAGGTITDAVHRILLGAGFQDAFLCAGLRDGMASNTYHGYDGAAYDLRLHHLSWRLDWVLFRGAGLQVDVERSEIVRSHRGALYPSDHYPVFADLDWK